MGELKRRLQRLNLQTLQNQTKEIILQDQEILRRKKAELKAGIRPDGSIIGTYRSEEYRLFKIQMNPLAGGNVDLILTGSTKDKMYIVALENGEFTIESADPKWADLVAKYGEEIKGINLEVFKGMQKSRHAPKLIQEMKRISQL